MGTLLGRTVTVLALVAWSAARAADHPDSLPGKAAAVSKTEAWSGFYIGGHGGYSTGRSSWSATQPGRGVPTLTGSLDFFNTFDAFKRYRQLLPRLNGRLQLRVSVSPAFRN